MILFSTELSPDLRELEYFSKSLMAFCYDQGIENGYRLDIAMGEILANIITHGDVRTTDKIHVQFRQSQNRQIIDVKYRGKSFNPLVGVKGLRPLPEDVGLNLINTYLTPLSYIFKSGENICQFSNKLSYSQAPQVMQQ